MLSVVREYKDYSVLGHMDLIARYDEKGVYPFEKIKPIVEEILQVVIADGKGLEVNTSSYRYGLSDTTPSVEILKRYRELGGKIVTIGSDSHKPEHLGAYIEETKEMLRKQVIRSFVLMKECLRFFMIYNNVLLYKLQRKRREKR